MNRLISKILKLTIYTFLAAILFIIAILISFKFNTNFKYSQLLSNKYIFYNKPKVEILKVDNINYTNSIIVNCKEWFCELDVDQCRKLYNPRLSLYSTCNYENNFIFYRNGKNPICGTISDSNDCYKKLLNLLELSMEEYENSGLLDLIYYFDQIYLIEHLFYDSVRIDPIKIINNENIIIFHGNGFSVFHSYKTTFEVRMKSSLKYKIDIAKKLKFVYN